MATNDNPYQTPRAALTNEAVEGVSGNLDDALAGRYDFDIGEVIREAWSKVPGSKRVFLTAGFAIFLVVMVASVVLVMIIPGARSADPGVATRVLMQLGTTVVVYPFMVGMTMLGIRRAAGFPIEFQQAFGYFHLVVPVVIAAVLISVLSMIGFALLVLPGIYLTFAYLFTLPLIADKNLGPWEAMETSRKAVTHHWFKVFGLMFGLGLVLAAPLILGAVVIAIVAVGSKALAGIVSVLMIGVFLAIMIWGGPLAMIAIGVLYRIIFGIEEQTLRGA